jgi:hypothetical protein
MKISRLAKFGWYLWFYLAGLCFFSSLVICLARQNVQDTTISPAPQEIHRVFYLSFTSGAADIITAENTLTKYPHIPDVVKSMLCDKGLAGEVLPTSTMNILYSIRKGYVYDLILFNNDESKAMSTLKLYMPAGVYSIDQINFSLLDKDTSLQKTRLSPVLLGKAGVLQKPIWQKPHTGSFLRIVNRESQSAEMCGRVWEGLRQMQKQNMTCYRHLRNSFMECSENVSIISRGVNSANRYDRIRNIHRALLNLAHTRSLFSNYVGDGQLDREGNAQVEEGMKSLDASLTDMSMGCLGLNAQINIEPGTVDSPDFQRVVISLSNGGGMSVANVRIGLEVPEGVHAEPSLEAMFGNLAPGQSASAAFKLQGVKPEMLEHISGTIVYFAARTPARIVLPLY